MRVPLFRRPEPFRLPEGLRVYAVGDVHGRADLLAAMERRIVRAEETAPPAAETLVIFLGDYVDRGPASRSVVERLAGRRFAGLPARFLLGNHEDAMLAFLADPVIGEGWLRWGAEATLASYGVDPPDWRDPAAIAAARVALAARLPAAHLAFLDDLEPAIELGGFLFVHAGIRPGVPLDRQRRADLTGIRAPFLGARRSLGRRVVHGHTIADTVELLPHRVGVDTGAYATDRLSAVVIEGEEVRILPD